MWAPRLEKQIKKLEDEHGVIPGKQIPEIPPEQANITEVTDPEEDKDKLNWSNGISFYN